MTMPSRPTLAEAIASGPLLLDGAMGSLLYERGVLHTRSYDELNLSQPELIRRVHHDYVAAGGLMSYLSSNAWHWRTSAEIVDKILKGAKPADVPVAQPTEFTLALNLGTAKALGIVLPPSILLQADRKIP